MYTHLYTHTDTQHGKKKMKDRRKRGTEDSWKMNIMSNLLP